MTKTLCVFLLALASAFIFPPARAEGRLPARHRLAAETVLRAAPDAAAPEAGLAQAGKDLEILGFSEDGLWAEAGRGAGVAWLPAAGLTRLQPPADEGLPMRCYGTEPFWGLNMPSAFFAEFERPEHPEAPLQITGSDAATGPGGHTRLWTFVGEELRGHLAVRNEACSDGMSDRHFGLSAVLSLAETAGAVHLRLGCCALSAP
ncbi:hypothetical protein [Mangrovicoccus algicola]|uniref:SH3 domain-containing protein n=1 Tax=Mangrovicoccus algicola TaxID=2771008 RepID=A0A8J7CI01_9RHOB|nr:hypothetical protein [Mangrovicoccus algicola]MBE3638955.1 hypothetical protein [Mangrovicoccus algicola]